MTLYHYSNKKNKVKLQAHNIYSRIVILSKNYVKELNIIIEKDFTISFEIFSLFLIMFFKASNEVKLNDFDKIKEELMNIFIKDLDTHFREVGIGDISIGKYVKAYVRKFYFRVKIFDQILDSQDKKEFKKFLSSINNEILSEEIFKSVFDHFDKIKEKLKNNQFEGYLIE